MKKTISLVIAFAIIAIATPKTNAAFDWEKYFSKNEGTAIKRMVDNYIRDQIEENDKNWKGIIGKKQVDNSIAKRKVYTGTIACDDSIADESNESGENTYYYKKISVPELDLSDMPQIDVYSPSSDLETDKSFLGSDLWASRNDEVDFQDGYVWVYYGADLGDGIDCTDGFSSYKVVVNY
jgi:hypothetical protein